MSPSIAHGLKMEKADLRSRDTEKMAENTDKDAEPVYTYDLINGTFINEGTEIMDNLTAEEKEEVEQVIHLIRRTQSPDGEANRHKPIDSAELDRLACKNSAESTSYQTNWAVAVFQGIYF